MFTKNFVLSTEGTLYLPVPDAANFQPVSLEVRPLASDVEATAFRHDATRTCQESCGNVACKSMVAILPEFAPDTSVRTPAKAILYCKDVEICPLNIPPTNDNELLVPKIAPPSLSTHAVSA